MNIGCYLFIPLISLSGGGVAQERGVPISNPSIEIKQSEFRKRVQFKMVVFRDEPIEETARLIWIPPDWVPSTTDDIVRPTTGFQVALYRSSESGLSLIQMKHMRGKYTSSWILGYVAGSGLFGQNLSMSYIQFGRIGDTDYGILKLVKKEDLGKELPPQDFPVVELLSKYR